MTIREILKPEVEILIQEAKLALKEVKKVAIAQAWKILQLAIAKVIQAIELAAIGMAGKDKKTIAMEILSKFYDSVFVVVDIPFVPSVIEPIIHKYVKSFLMILVGSTIDAMVATFKDTGVFPPKDVDPALDSVQKVSDK